MVEAIEDKLVICAKLKSLAFKSLSLRLRYQYFWALHLRWEWTL